MFLHTNITSIHLLDFGTFILHPEKCNVMMCVSAGAQSPVFDLELYLFSFLLIGWAIAECIHSFIQQTLMCNHHIQSC